MNVPVAVFAPAIAYTYIGIELIVAGIVTIAMHFGIRANPQAAVTVYLATGTPQTAYPIWGGALAIVIGITGVVVGSGAPKSADTVKGFTVAAIIGVITQFIAFCFSCNSIRMSVDFIRVATGPFQVYNYVPIVYSVVYMIIFLTNFSVCLRSLFVGRMIYRSYTAVVVQPGGGVVVAGNVPMQPPGYTNNAVTPMTTKPPQGP